MSNSRKNGSPLLREVLFKAPAPVDKTKQPIGKTKKSLNDMDEMFKHPRSNPKYAYLFPTKAEAKSAEAKQTVTEETTTPTLNNP